MQINRAGGIAKARENAMQSSHEQRAVLFFSIFLLTNALRDLARSREAAILSGTASGGKILVQIFGITGEEGDILAAEAIVDSIPDQWQRFDLLVNIFNASGRRDSLEKARRIIPFILPEKKDQAFLSMGLSMLRVVDIEEVKALLPKIEDQGKRGTLARRIAIQISKNCCQSAIDFIEDEINGIGPAEKAEFYLELAGPTL